MVWRSKPAVTSIAVISAAAAGIGTATAVSPRAAAPRWPIAAASHIVASRATGEPAQPGQAIQRTACDQPRAGTVGDAKKGVSLWPFPGVEKALERSGASWYYTWWPAHDGTVTPPGVQFVPMIWGPGNVTPRTLRHVRREGHYLLGFNEPDRHGQSDLTVSKALHLWRELMATGMTLGSPAVANHAATPGGWLDRFMRGAARRHYPVGFIAVHWYGEDFATGSAVRQLHAYLAAIHARYRLPIWVTEFALIKFGSPRIFPSPRQQAAFISGATSMLDHLRYVQRYAWFTLPTGHGDGTAGLFRPGAVATAAGRAFEAAGSAQSNC